MGRYDKLLGTFGKTIVKDSAADIAAAKAAKMLEKRPVVVDTAPESIVNLPQYYKEVASGQHPVPSKRAVGQNIDELHALTPGSVPLIHADKLNKLEQADKFITERFNTLENAPKDIQDAYNKIKQEHMMSQGLKKMAAIAPGVAVVKPEISPLPYLGELNQGYQKAKEAIIEPVAKQMNFTKRPQDLEDIKNTLSTVGDPINYIPGGEAAAAVQMMSPESTSRFKNLKSLIGK